MNPNGAADAQSADIDTVAPHLGMRRVLFREWPSPFERFASVRAKRGFIVWLISRAGVTVAGLRGDVNPSELADNGRSRTSHVQADNDDASAALSARSERAIRAPGAKACAAFAYVDFREVAGKVKSPNEIYFVLTPSDIAPSQGFGARRLSTSAW
jgi:hypothetical protein